MRPELCWPSYLSLLLFHHVLSHLEGAQVLVHVLDLCVFGGVLAAVQQLGDGVVIVVDHVALLAIFVVTCRCQKEQKKVLDQIAIQRSLLAGS